MQEIHVSFQARRAAARLKSSDGAERKRKKKKKKERPTLLSLSLSLCVCVCVSRDTTERGSFVPRSFSLFPRRDAALYWFSAPRHPVIILINTFGPMLIGASWLYLPAPTPERSRYLSWKRLRVIRLTIFCFFLFFFFFLFGGTYEGRCRRP